MPETSKQDDATLKTDWHAIETLIRNDPGGRGLTTFIYQDEWLAKGGLEAAAHSLASRAARVAIATGFAIVGHGAPAAETDGPPGALYLARALDALGIESILISDCHAMPLLRAGVEHWSLDRVELLEFPFQTEPTLVERWIDDFLSTERNRRLTHLVAIERVGPSHTLESLSQQVRIGPPPIVDFERDVPPADRDCCHNMRGLVIDIYTAPLHRLFENAAARRPEIETIGIADGGNEIGMGCIPWELLRHAIACGPGGCIACRIAVDHLILAGISNWGAYALAAGLAALRNRTDLIPAWGADKQRRLIEVLVSEAGAVDGVTRLRQPTVDGVPLREYLAVLTAIESQTLRRA